MVCRDSFLHVLQRDYDVVELVHFHMEASIQLLGRSLFFIFDTNDSLWKFGLYAQKEGRRILMFKKLKALVKNQKGKCSRCLRTMIKMEHTMNKFEGFGSY